MPRSPSENQKTFTEDPDFRYDEAILVRNARDIPTPNMSDDDEDTSVFALRGAAGVTRELIDSDDSEEDTSAFMLQRKQQSSPKLPRQQSSSVRPPSAGPSHRRSSLRSQSPAILDIQRLPEPVAYDSDSDDSRGKANKTAVPGEYDPSLYDNLNVNEDIKEVFQYITKYVPQQLNLDYKFKPFTPEYLPAVGDIDAFLKVVPPETTLSGSPFDSTKPHLGLVVLDEPAANQSDPALLHLRLRSASVHSNSNTNVVVKKVEDVSKNGKIIDKWMKDISDLHRTKSSPLVKYPDPMPNLDDLMQEWPENMENLLKVHGFPSSKFSGSLAQYIDVVCSIFDIPVYKNKIFSLHLLFCLYAAIKNSLLYQANNFAPKSASDDYEANNSKGNTADQLVLE